CASATASHSMHCRALVSATRPAPARPKRSASQLNTESARCTILGLLSATSASASSASREKRMCRRLPKMRIATTIATRNAAAVSDAVHSTIASMRQPCPVIAMTNESSAPTIAPATAKRSPKLASSTGWVAIGIGASQLSAGTAGGAGRVTPDGIGTVLFCMGRERAGQERGSLVGVDLGAQHDRRGPPQREVFFGARSPNHHTIQVTTAKTRLSATYALSMSLVFIAKATAERNVVRPSVSAGRTRARTALTQG